MPSGDGGSAVPREQQDCGVLRLAEGDHRPKRGSCLPGPGIFVLPQYQYSRGVLPLQGRDEGGKAGWWVRGRTEVKRDLKFILALK